MKKIAKKKVVVANKGGVGKTTTALNTAAALRELGEKVLVCDLDPQGHLTKIVAPRETENSNNTLYQVFTGEKNLSEIIISNHKKYDIVPCSPKLTFADEKFEDVYIFEKALKEVEKDYDYIIIDSPHDHGIMSFNSMIAADEIYLIVQTEYLALASIPQMFAMIKIAQQHKEEIYLSGVIKTMYDSRITDHKNIKREIDDYFKNTAYETTIRRNAQVSASPARGQDIFEYDKHSAGARDFYVLALEMLLRDKKIKGDIDTLKKLRPKFMRFSERGEYNRLLNNIAI